MPLRLRVNGAIRTVDLEPGIPLLWVLRDELQLTGTKFGCGVGACGACTVHLAGEAVRSCITPVSAVGQTALPTDAEIDAAMTGNVCRCGTYDRIRRAIHRAAARSGR